MKRSIDHLKTTVYDLLVVGGGINGASIAHLAAKRGLKTALLEKGDFGSGTSSKSTKMIHGGIRYLENMEFDLVYESLHERLTQLEAAPHLVKPLGLIIPVYRTDKRPVWMMRLGVFLYDLLAGKFVVKPHKGMSAQEIIAAEPRIEQNGLTGGVLYYDAQMDDYRLCLENVLSADQAGADTANHVEVYAFLKEGKKAVGVHAHDLLTGEKFEVRAKKVVCTAGPWTNILLRLDHTGAPKKVRTTKGVHLVLRGEMTKNAYLIASQRDNRIFFIIPWYGTTLIGTTDTSYSKSPDQVRVEPEDIQYLIGETKRVFPGMDLSEKNIITSFAGLRPLIRKGGSPNKLSRKHLYYKSPSGVFFVVGGKYTTYRKVSAECLDKIFKKVPNEKFELYGGGKIVENPKDVSAKTGVPEDSVKALMARYGTRYKDVLALAERAPELKQKISPELPLIKAEVPYAIEVEMARSVEDVFYRLFLNYTAMSEQTRLIITKYIEQCLKG